MHLEGLFEPKNFAEDTGGGVREGCYRVTGASVVMDQKKTREGKDPTPAYLAIRWACVQLDNDNHEPMETPEGESVQAVFNFGLGKSAHEFIHPCAATSPDDDDPEDQGVELGAEGNTLFPTEKYLEGIEKERPWRLHPQTAWAKMLGSLAEHGWKPELLKRVWPEDFVGSDFFITTIQEPTGEKEMRNGKEQERTIPYKVVKQIIKAGYEKGAAKGKAAAKPAAKGVSAGKASATATPTAKPTAASTASDDLDALLMEFLAEVMVANSGKTLNAQKMRVEMTKHWTKSKKPANLMGSASAKLKDADWLAEQAENFGFMVDGEEVTFA